MVGETIAAISEQLSMLYGEKVPILVDREEQDASAPCFFIEVANTEKQEGLANSYQLLQTFRISYYPKSSGGTLEAAAVLSALYGLLDMVRVNGSLVRGSGMSGSIAKGVLNFQVSYRLFLSKEEEIPSMEGVAVFLNRK